MTSAPARVRAAVHHDLPEIVRLAIVLGRQHERYDARRFALSTFAVDGGLEAAYEAFFREQLTRGDASVLVSEKLGSLVAYAFVRLEDESLLDLSSAAGWVHDVLVDDTARDAGIGDALFTEALATLRRLGAKTIRLSAATQNSRARSFFERRGFRPTMIEYSLDDPTELEEAP